MSARALRYTYRFNFLHIQNYNVLVVTNNVHCTVLDLTTSDNVFFASNHHIYDLRFDNVLIPRGFRFQN